MKIISYALLLTICAQPLLSAEIDEGKCEVYRKGNEKNYPSCLKNKKNHPCEVVKRAKTWRDVLYLLKGKGIIDNPSTLVEYTFDGENMEYTMTFEEGTMMAKKYGIRKIPGYIKIINDYEIEYSLLKPLDGPCKGIANKVSCSVMQTSIGPVLLIGFEGKPDSCGINTFLNVGLDMMDSEHIFYPQSE